MRIGTPPDEMPLDKFSGQPKIKATSTKNFHAIINEIDSEFSHGKLFSELNAGLSTVSSNNDEIKVSYKSEGPLKLTVFNSDMWKVSTKSAVLSDRTLRRHYPFPKDTGYSWKREQPWGICLSGNIYNFVAPVGRLWQSFFEPLHPQEPVVLFYDKNGKGFSVTVDSTNADNIVLTDRSDDCPNEPFGLELRFYQKDPDLNDTTRYFGFEPAFITQPMPQNATNRQLEVELSIRPVELSEEYIPAPRFQYSDIYTTQLKIGDGFCIPVEGIRINKPSTIKWQELSCPAGSYRLKFTVKYSEKWFKSNKHKNAYIVKFNEEPLKLEWGDLDKTSGFGVLWSE
ncbi:MAG: hypothetical protein KAR20_29515, partial [Candidatus Heimdallarchaeota archaeon]|nr:hypothetical protein [Candidatus Heimdallarchaeota archaeon]